MINWVINKIALRICDWCERNGRVYKITGGPSGQTVYLVRYIAFKSKYACLYIHRFMRSDADDPHDHPWNFFTYVISGGYIERFYDKSKAVISGDDQNFMYLYDRIENKRSAGSIAYRKATDIHQVVVDKSRDMQDILEAPFTICLMGPRIREWGFWNKRGDVFTDWRTYLNISPDDPRITGSE